MGTAPLLRIAAIVGPTASGKTDLALELAERLPLEVISCDSQAVFEGMDIGTAKPDEESRSRLPHHLVDVAKMWEEFSAARYVELADEAIADIASKGKLPLVVGGTGLYLRSLLTGIVEAPPKDEGLRASLEEIAEAKGNAFLHGELEKVDPDAAARIPIADRVRIVRALEVYRLTGKPLSWHHERHRATPRYRAAVIGVTPPRDELYRRVNLRAAKMFEEGLLEETASLAKDPRAMPRLKRCMGYREALAHLEGRISLEEALEKTRLEQRRYAKRQLTWFRKMDVRWLPWPPDVGEAVEAIEKAFENIEKSE